MAGNVNLGSAKAARQDEFYTQLPDIERELRHYRRHFKGKTVLCNCDDPYESNFFRYFALNFNNLGLAKLIATCYAGSPFAGTQLSLFDVLGERPRAGEDVGARPYKAVVTSVRDATGDGGIDMLDVAELFKSGENQISVLEGDGDFRSPECLALLDEADIVATNPPFSLFREYVTTLIEHGKDFVIIGPNNGIKYKETFPYIRDGKMWLGYNNGDMAFRVPDYFEPRATRYWQDDDGQKWRSMGNICWFTNLDIKKRHDEMVLVRHYSPERYLHYTNFDGIDVPHVVDMPCDWAGNMGVPITFLESHNPDQFQIVGLGEGDLAKEIGITRDRTGRTKLQTNDNGKLANPYARIVIRNLHPELPRS